MIKLIKNIKLSLFFKSRVYNFFVNNNAEKKIIFNPESLWRGNKVNGLRILEGFLSYQNETLNLDKNIWKKNHGSSSWNNHLHGFMWIKDIRAVGTNNARIFVRRNLLAWIDEVNYSNEQIWKEDVIAKRIFYLLTNLSFFFETADENFQKIFSEHLNKQSMILYKIIKKKEKINIFSVKSMILSTFCFDNLNSLYSFSIKLLLKTVKEDISDDGLHRLRSPSQHFFFLCSLLDIKNFLGNMNREIPEEINQKIDQMLSTLKFFRIGNGQLAIFNTYDTININQIDNLLKKVDHKYRLPKITSCSDFYRASKNKLTLIMDCGTPTKEKTHAGTLSFEFSHLSEKIVVNCGSPFVNNKNWHDAMRSTAAHSTLNINEINSSDIFFEKDTTTRIAKTHSSQFNDNDNICIDSYHTGYRSLFGLLHRRLIHIDQKKLIVRGEDSLIYEKKSSNNQKYFLRFHIHPSIKLNVTTSKKKVVLKLKNNVGWEFICSEPNIKIEDGIYLGENKIVQPNQHILISDFVVKGQKIKWLFRLIN